MLPLSSVGSHMTIPITNLYSPSSDKVSANECSMVARRNAAVEDAWIITHQISNLSTDISLWLNLLRFLSFPLLFCYGASTRHSVEYLFVPAELPLVVSELVARVRGTCLSIVAFERCWYTSINHTGLIQMVWCGWTLPLCKYLRGAT